MQSWAQVGRSVWGTFRWMTLAFTVTTIAHSEGRPPDSASVAISNVGSFSQPVGNVIVRVHRHEQEFLHHSDPKFPHLEPVAVVAGDVMETPIVTVHRFDSDSRSYKKLYQFEVARKQLPEVIVPDHSGERLAFVYTEYGKVGLRVMTDRGTKQKFWPITEMLLTEDQRLIPRTGSSFPWFMTGRFQGDQFYFSNRAHMYEPTDPLREGLTSDQLKLLMGYHYVLDVKAGTFQKIEPLPDVPPSRSKSP